MKNDSTITASELFLLCQLRGAKYVRAKNLVKYKHKDEDLDPSFRTYLIAGNDLGYSLSDQDKGACWFLPNDIEKEWSYGGDFELDIPLTEKEAFFLQNYKCA